ncbi:DMT family transporter [Alicyclobacillus mengziensis]|uniref:DMT family transporter n=1 Tax=Alicyclobacillus mengziensis TaxID=2931921 RepID=A0A9X7W182_9BACL|nr:DMT family transporter [Alicyclobacillus mengziensis]QSO48577.1 DMT family transporter [Alicyclobacillus mengziensis]
MVRPIFALLFVSALWGSHPVVGQLVEKQMSPFALTVWRFTLSAICYLPLSKSLVRILKLPAATLWRLFGTAVFWCVLYPLFYYESLRSVPPIDSLLLVNSAPLLAAVFAYVFLRERLGRREWLGIVVAFLGVILLTGYRITFAASWTGIGCAALAAASFAGYTVLSRRLFQELALFDVLFSTTVLGAIVLWMLTLVTGQAHDITLQLMHLSKAGMWEFVYIGVAVSTIAYVFYGYGLRRLPAAVSSAITFYPQVFFAGLLQWVWTGQAPTVWTWVAVAFVFAGTALMSFRKRARLSAPQEVTEDA